MSTTSSSSPAQPALLGAAWRPDGNGGAVLLPDVCTAMEAASYLRLGCETPKTAAKAMGRLRRLGLLKALSHGRGRPLLFRREDLVNAARTMVNERGA